MKAMEKKEYTAPAVVLVKTEATQLLSGSGVNATGLEYGGVDTGGAIDPSSRALLDLLDI
jgi:hypothetical protein